MLWVQKTVLDDFTYSNSYFFLVFYVELPIEYYYGIRLYRGPMLLILFLFLIGGNTYGWRTSGVNHVLIFELDPRHHLTYQQFLEVGVADSA